VWGGVDAGWKLERRGNSPTLRTSVLALKLVGIYSMIGFNLDPSTINIFSWSDIKSLWATLCLRGVACCIFREPEDGRDGKSLRSVHDNHQRS
jgi:hypothetical protein